MSDAKPKTIDCRYCDGLRHLSPSGKTCTGCGSPAANAKRHQPPRKFRAAKCPQCRGFRTRRLTPPGEADVEYSCLDCGGHFAPADFEMIDDRPEQNAAKKERYKNGGKRGAYSRG